MAVVTINGRVGAPSRVLGIEVAHALGADYVDHQILTEAAKRTGTAVEAVAQRDEKAIRGKERLARFIQSFLEKSAAAGSAGDPFLGPTGVEVLLSRGISDAAPGAAAQDLNDKRYLEVMTTVIKDLASGGNVVMIGRGAHVILRDLPSALHVYVVSSEEARVRFLNRREGLSPEEAARYIRENDPLRVRYYKKFFNVDSENPTLFHLFLNVDKLGMEHAVQIIANSAREMERQVAPV